MDKIIIKLTLRIVACVALGFFTPIVDLFCRHRDTNKIHYIIFIRQRLMVGTVSKISA